MVSLARELAFDGQDFTVRRSANIILWVVLGFVAVAVAWAALTKIDRSVRGVGRVVPSSKLQVVSNLEGGVIEEILIRAGQEVKKGDVLVRLSPTLTGAAFGSSSAEVGALQAKIARLEAEVKGTRPNYGSVAPEQIAIEQSLYTARMAELGGSLAAARARLAQAERAAGEARPRLEARRSSMEAAEQEYDLLRPLAETQIISKVELIQAQSAALVARKEYEAAQESLARAQSGVAEARAQLAQARSDWLARSGMDLSQAQAELSSKLKQLPALSDRVDRTVIRAPLSGRVNRVMVTTVGGTVNAGEPIAEIVPSDDVLYVEALVSPQSIGNVRLDQQAEVEITAYNRAIYGTLKGTVTAISPDAVFDEQTRENFYTVEIQTTGDLLDGEQELAIGPGMVANVHLLGEKRSVLSYIFTPITRLKDTAFRD